MTPFDQLQKRFPNLIPIPELRASISIIELARYHGYQLQPRKGKTRPVLTHPDYHDTILIKNPQDAAQQLYQRVGNFTDSGTLIDFVGHRLTTLFARFDRPDQHALRNITDVLYEYLRIDPINLAAYQPSPVQRVGRTTKSPFDLEQFDIRPLEPDHYLLQRHITPATLERPEFVGKVVTQVTYYNDQTQCVDNFSVAKQHSEHAYCQFHNVAFPYYNGETDQVTGLELRNKGLKMHATRSDRSRSVFVSNPPPKVRHFYVMESAIDALSHRQLRSQEGDEAFDSVYFSTGGQLTDQQVNTITRYVSSLAKESDWRMHLAFDKDGKGCQYDLRFIQQLASASLPIQPVSASGNRISYEWPKPNPSSLLLDTLLKSIQVYNQQAAFRSVPLDERMIEKESFTGQPIHINQSTDKLTINLLDSVAVLTAFNYILLEITGLDRCMNILKAQGKDFNEDISRGS